MKRLPRLIVQAVNAAVVYGVAIYLIDLVLDTLHTLAYNVISAAIYGVLLALFFFFFTKKEDKDAK